MQAVESRFAQRWLNINQDRAVSAPLFPPMFIVAGPGTGKTTVLALRVLKHIFVDGLPPESIMATTFTRKAAKELRSRILSWGVALHQEIQKQAELTNDNQRLAWLRSLDINGVRTGTLDSLAEEMIENDRQPGEITPTVVESFMATGLMRRNVLFQNQRYNNTILENHLESFNPGFPGVKSFSKKLKICRAFADRVIHDQIDLQAYAVCSPGHRLLAEIVQDYHQYLRDSQLVDFALLENDVFERLKSGRLVSTVQRLKALLVDEFQDTNYLQEQIYYELCRRSGACLTVVGDDDQSIFRFRGATVEIFSDFANRLSSALGTNWQPVRVNLTENYRSTERIVSFCTHFITSEPDFHAARTPGKQACVPSAQWAKNPSVNMPVLGLFRNDIEELSVDLCQFLGEIFYTNGKGWIRPVSGGIPPLSIQPNVDGNFGDAVFLAWQAGESNYKGEPRLPLLIRQELKRKYNVDVFNPRGRVLASIPEVAQCLGLMLECIDPNGQIQSSIQKIRPDVVNRLNDWRDSAKRFIASDPSPGGLGQFVDDWGRRTTSIMNTWPKEWPLLELMFTIITWLPFFHTNPEGQVYLEAISRAISEAGQIASYRSLIYTGAGFDDKAVSQAIREVFEPIASGDVDVDEEIMPYVPRSHFPIMTIHQAKGLEFPLVILDVGSDYRTNHPTQRRSRYPNQGSKEHLTEDHTAAFSPVGPARMLRTDQQRAFDDIRRLYYVAKSRPQNVLVLVGLTSQLKLQKSSPKIPSVATGDLFAGSRSYNFIPVDLWTPGSSANTIALI
jgi:DNA helicase-2/ATP-dependent DNA helicase PcrA